MRRDKILIFGVCAVLIAAGAAVYIYVTQPQSATRDALSQRAQISSLFDTRSAVGAFEFFKTENAKRPVPAQHTAAHLFGEVLYEKKGLEGLSVCDGSFGFGCFHTLIGLAIADHGTGVVKDLDAACITAYGPGGTGCFHGLGHGLLSYFGYTNIGADRALSLCGTLSWQRPLGGCADGVFMEYNFRTMEADPSKQYRPFTEADTYEPCLSLSMYAEGCYFGLPAWWATALPNDTSLPARLGALCEGVATGDLKRSCYRGIGYGILPVIEFEATRGESFCDATAKGEARVWCREGLAWAFYADPATREQAEGICSTHLSESEALQCSKGYLFVIQ